MAQNENLAEELKEAQEILERFEEMEEFSANEDWDGEMACAEDIVAYAKKVALKTINDFKKEGYHEEAHC